MKRCSLCEKDRPISEFSWRNKSKGTRQSRCKDCFRRLENEKYRASETERARKKRNRDRTRQHNQSVVWKYLQEHPCVDCGESDPVVLEFDHRSDKKHNISEILRSYNKSILVEEIAKCDVRCANCHRRKTARDFNHWKILPDVG